MKCAQFLLVVTIGFIVSACSMEPSQPGVESRALVSNGQGISGHDWQQIASGVFEKNKDGTVVRYAYGADGADWLIGQATVELVELQKQYNTAHDAQVSRRIAELQNLIEKWGASAEQWPVSVRPALEGSTCSGGGGICVCPGGCYADSSGCGCF